MKNVITYSRVSTDEQAQQGYSLDYQEEAIIRYCHLKGYNIIQSFREDYSAKDFGRPEWKRIISLIKSNRKTNSAIDSIVILRPDRFSRNLLLSFSENAKLEGLGCAVEFLEGQVDDESSSAVLLKAIGYALPQMENERISRTSREGSHTARMMGCWTGQAPKGYKNIRIDKNSTLAPSEHAPLIVQGFEKMASGLYSADEVRRWLNGKGLKLSKNMFPNIIRNVVYTGKIYVKEFKKEPSQVVRGLHPPLISDELFAEANRVLDGRKRNMKFHDDKSNLYPLKGHLKCVKHNLSLTAGKCKGRYGIYHYYNCSVKNDRCKRYPIDWVHGVVEDELRQIQFSANVFKAYRSILERLFDNEDVERKRNIIKIKSDIEKKTAQRNNVQELLRDGKLTIEEYRELKNPIDSDLFRLERELSILNEETTPFKDYIRNHVPMMENLLEFYQNSDGKTKKKILSCIFSEKIHFDENKVAAISFHKPIEVLLNASKVLQRSKKEKEVKKDLLPILAPLFLERCNYNAMIEYVTIRKLKG